MNMINNTPRTRLIDTNFITEWTVGAGDSVTLPLITGNTYTFTVTWGDGASNIITAFDDADRIHTYTNAGTYTVKIEGINERWDFNSVATSKDKITKVLNWGDVGWTSMADAFYDCTNLISTSTGGTYLSGIDMFSYMFHGCANLAFMSSIDSSFGSDFSNMFQSCTVLVSLPAVFDLSSAASCSFMFINCQNLTTLPDLNSGSCGSFSFMFINCISLISLPTIFDVSSGTNFSAMFFHCISLISLPTIFDVSSGTNFSAMFLECTSLISLPTIFDVSLGTNFTDMFKDCPNLSSGTLQGCKATISIEDCDFDKAGLEAFANDLGDGTGQTWTVTGNPGAATFDDSVAVGKNWTVVRS